MVAMDSARCNRNCHRRVLPDLAAVALNLGLVRGMIVALFLICALALPQQSKLTRFEQLKAIVEINPEFEFFVSPYRPDGCGWKKTRVELLEFKVWARVREAA